MTDEVKLVAMFFEGHSGPGGRGYRGRDAGTTIMVSEQMAALLDKKTGWKRGSMAPASPAAMTAPEPPAREQRPARRPGRKRG